MLYTSRLDDYLEKGCIRRSCFSIELVKRTSSFMVGVRLADLSSPSVVDVFAAGVCSLGSHKYRVGAEECLRLWRYLCTIGNLLSDQFGIAFDVVHLRT